MLIRAQFFRWTILTSNVSQSDLVLVRDQGSLVGLCVQDYKSLEYSGYNHNSHPRYRQTF